MEANVEIKDITELVTDCGCCPGGGFINIVIDYQYRKSRVSSCTVIRTPIPGRETGVAYQRVRNTQTENGWRQEDRPSIIGAHPATQCPAIYSEGGSNPDAVGLRSVDRGWNGDFPPTFNIRNGRELSVYSEPVYASDFLNLAQSEIDNKSWELGQHRSFYKTTAGTSDAGVEELRLRFMLPIEHYGSGWLATLTIGVAYDVFVQNPVTPYRAVNAEQQRFDIQIVKEFVFTELDEDNTYSDWYTTKELLIGAGVDLNFNPFAQLYTLTGLNFERLT